MARTAAEYREQDISDLMDAWRRAIDVLRFDWSTQTASRAQRSFDEILNYLHAGEIPEVPKSEEQQVLVRHSFTTNLREGFA